MVQYGPYTGPYCSIKKCRADPKKKVFCGGDDVGRHHLYTLWPQMITHQAYPNFRSLVQHRSLPIGRAWNKITTRSPAQPYTSWPPRSPPRHSAESRRLVSSLQDRARRDRRHEGIQLQLRRWAEGDRRGLVHGAAGGCREVGHRDGAIS